MHNQSFTCCLTGMTSSLRDCCWPQEQTIDAQYYHLHDDPTGHLFASSLVQAADHGVRVRLLLDDMDTSGYDPMTAALELHPNIEIRLFNPLWREKGNVLCAKTDFSCFNRRMHNKSMTFDNVFTIVGGRNIGAKYFLANETTNYVDLDVLAAGQVVPDVSDSYDEYWSSRFAVPARVVIGELTDMTLNQARTRWQQLEGEPPRNRNTRYSQLSLRHKYNAILEC